MLMRKGKNLMQYTSIEKKPNFNNADCKLPLRQLQDRYLQDHQHRNMPLYALP